VLAATHSTTFNIDGRYELVTSPKRGRAVGMGRAAFVPPLLKAF
jgi:hypothetical protein